MGIYRPKVEDRFVLFRAVSVQNTTPGGGDEGVRFTATAPTDSVHRSCHLVGVMARDIL
jgi:hypothetical protein